MFEEAWKHSDIITKSGINRDYLNLPRHYQCIWDGSPLEDKRVLVRCYHGLGDTIQFIRYLPHLKKIASEVTLWAQPRLIELLQTTDGFSRLIPLNDGEPGIEYDADIEIMELPYYFRTTLETIPSDFPYLYVQPLNISARQHKFAAGIVWKAGDWDTARNIPFSILKPLFNIKGIDIYILQDDAAGAGWQPGYGIHPGKCTLYEHARIIAGLSVLITIDSMPAHLAGALSIPVWLLLHSEPDWRWMEGRSDSPWYPSMKIFRQAKPGDWDSIIRSVVSELRRMT